MLAPAGPRWEAGGRRRGSGPAASEVCAGEGARGDFRPRRGSGAANTRGFQAAPLRAGKAWPTPGGGWGGGVLGSGAGLRGLSDHPRRRPRAGGNRGGARTLGGGCGPTRFPDPGFPFSARAGAQGRSSRRSRMNEPGGGGRAGPGRTLHPGGPRVPPPLAHVRTRHPGSGDLGPTALALTISPFNAFPLVVPAKGFYSALHTQTCFCSEEIV